MVANPSLVRSAGAAAQLQPVMRKQTKRQILKPLLVLDKSWLLGASRQDLSRAIARFHLIAPEALLYEAATTETKQRIDCVGKLLTVGRSVSTIGPLGHLVNWEVEAREPCGRLLRHCHEGGIVYLEKLADPEYVFSDDERWAVDAERSWRETETLGAFTYSASQIGKLVPTFGALHGLEEDSLLPRIQEYIHDKTLLGLLYQDVRAGFPTLPQRIGPQWATFRRIQAHILMAGEFVRRYGIHPNGPPSKRLVNLYLDVDYLVLGALAGALATRDGLLASFLKAMAPKSEVVNWSNA